LKPNKCKFYIFHFTLFNLSAPGRTEFPVDTYNSFMQNEPNFQRTLSMLSAVMIMSYNEKNTCQPAKTNPIEPDSNPIRTQLEHGQKSTSTPVTTRTYNEKTHLSTKNNEPNQTQSNPIRTQCLPPGFYNKNTPTRREKK